MWLPELSPQTIYRSFIGVAVISATAADGWHANTLAPFGVALLAIVYVVASMVLLPGLPEDDAPCRRTHDYLASADVFLTGGFIAYIDFAILPSAIFATITQCHSLANGGVRRWLRDNLTLFAGALVVMALKHPTTDLLLDQRVNVTALIAFAIYFSVFGYLAFARTNALRAQLHEMEEQQVELKLRNYSLSKYLSPALRDAISSGRGVKLESRRAPLTIFFSDIKGFSELAEEMDADSLTALLSDYLTEMSAIALRHGATIDKFIGDAMMIFFGDPTTQGIKMDAVACVAMAIEMKKRMKELQLRWRHQGILKPLQIRMGINTGYCTVGNFGTENRLDFTALGTEVNLANRLESAAEPDEILLTHASYMLVKDMIMCRSRGNISAKGFHDPIPVYSVVDLRRNLGKDQNYFEYATEGFAVYMDMDKIRNYDRDRVIRAIESAHHSLRDNPAEFPS